MGKLFNCFRSWMQEQPRPRLPPELMDIPAEQECTCVAAAAEIGETFRHYAYWRVPLMIEYGPDAGCKLFATFFNKSDIRHLGLDPEDTSTTSGKRFQVQIVHESSPDGRVFARPKILAQID